jgi:hypothetical protein
MAIGGLMNILSSGLRLKLHLFQFLGLSLISAKSFAASPTIPEEYESTGGHSLAFGGSTATAIGGVSSIRANPALLAVEREYAVNGAYHWPTAGRDFYQLGVVDGKTSSLAAGFSYTGAMDDYQGISSKDKTTSNHSNDPKLIDLSKDSPVIRRANLGFSLPIGRIFVGGGGGFVEAKPPVDAVTDPSVDKVKGFTVGFGMASNLTNAIRVGISGENLANRKVQFAAPTFYRAGISYFIKDTASFHFDYRRREAVAIYEGQSPSFSLNDSSDIPQKTLAPENFVNASSSVRLYDLLRLIAAVGHTNSESLSMTQASGGLSLVNQKFDFSYQLLKPDLSSDDIHHALSLGINVAL